LKFLARHKPVLFTNIIREPIEKLFDESVRSRKKMTAYFICSECYQEDYDEAMSQIDY
jgi:hypothetical protein